MFGQILGSIGQVLGIGSAPDYYKGATNTADYMREVMAGSVPIANTQASFLARVRDMAMERAQAMSGERGLDPRAFQSISQMIDQTYQSGVQEATDRARAGIAQALQAKIGVQEQDAQYRAQRNQSGLDFWRGLVGAGVGYGMSKGKKPQAGSGVTPGFGSGGAGRYPGSYGVPYGEIDPSAILPTVNPAVGGGYGGGYGAGGYGGFDWSRYVWPGR